MQQVEFRSGSFFIRGTVTASGEVEDFELGDLDDEILIEGVSFETLSRLLEHIRVEQHRMMYPQMVPQPASSGGPVVGSNKEPEPPIEGEING